MAVSNELKSNFEIQQQKLLKSAKFKTAFPLSFNYLNSGIPDGKFAINHNPFLK